MIDQVIIAIYLVIILSVGIWYGRDLHTVEDFAVSDIKYGSFVVFATLSASFIGGGFPTGNASKVVPSWNYKYYGIVGIQPQRDSGGKIHCSTHQSLWQCHFTIFLYSLTTSGHRSSWCLWPLPCLEAALSNQVLPVLLPPVSQGA